MNEDVKDDVKDDGTEDMTRMTGRKGNKVTTGTTTGATTAIGGAGHQPTVEELATLMAKAMAVAQAKFAVDSAKATLDALTDEVAETEQAVKDAIAWQSVLLEKAGRAAEAAKMAQDVYEAQAEQIAKAVEAARKAKRALALHTDKEPIDAGHSIDPDLKEILSTLTSNKDANQFYLDKHAAKINNYVAIKSDLEGPKGVS